MSGFVDLHCHYVPSVDDGVRSVEASVALLRGLREAGFERVVATPHIRTAMFPNARAGLEAAMGALEVELAGEDALPARGLAAEHFFDDVVYGLFLDGGALPYPGGHAALVELPPEVFPLGLAQRFFELSVRGVAPVLAHPERYAPLFQSSDAIDALTDAGALPLLDLMSLTGKYGRRPQRAAERMLEEGVYYAACSDCHRPEDVPVVVEAIAALRRLVGDEEAGELLRDNPRRVLDGTAVY